MKKHRTLEQTEPFLNKLQIIMNSFEKQSNKKPYLLYLVVSKEILQQLNLSASESFSLLHHTRINLKKNSVLLYVQP